MILMAGRVVVVMVVTGDGDDEGLSKCARPVPPFPSNVVIKNGRTSNYN